MVLKNIKYLSVFLLFLLACNNANNAKYDLTISLKDTYKLDNRKFFYKGTNLDTLQDRLSQIDSAAIEWARKNNKPLDSCASIPNKVLIRCSGMMNINELFTYNRILDFTNSGIAKFDIIVDTTILHCIGKFHDRGSLVIDAYGKSVDFDWEKEWNSLRILCNNDYIVFMFKNDTLFKGNYYDLKNHAQFNNDYIHFTRKKLPVIVINAVYNTTMTNIVKIRNKFKDADQFYFQFGKKFDCTSTLRDIYADTAIIDSVLYFSRNPRIK